MPELALAPVNGVDYDEDYDLEAGNRVVAALINHTPEQKKFDREGFLMTRQLEAIFQGGVLRPLQPLSLSEDQRVLVTIATIPMALDEADYLDTELHRFCEARADSSITLAQVRKELASIPGSIADDIIADREERF